MKKRGTSLTAETPVRFPQTLWLDPAVARQLQPMLDLGGALALAGMAIVQVRHGLALRVSIPSGLALAVLYAALLAVLLEADEGPAAVTRTWGPQRELKEAAHRLALGLSWAPPRRSALELRELVAWFRSELRAHVRAA